MAIPFEVTRAATGIAAVTGIARRRVPRCHHAAIPAAIQATTGEDRPLVRNWICTSRSCGVRPTVAGTAAIAARQITADLGLAMAEATVPQVTAAAVPLVMVEAAMPRAAVVVTRAVVEATQAEVAEATPAAAVTVVVVIAKSKDGVELM